MLKDSLTLKYMVTIAVKRAACAGRAVHMCISEIRPAFVTSWTETGALDHQRRVADYQPPWQPNLFAREIVTQEEVGQTVERAPYRVESCCENRGNREQGRDDYNQSTNKFVLSRTPVCSTNKATSFVFIIIFLNSVMRWRPSLIWR